MCCEQLRCPARSRSSICLCPTAAQLLREHRGDRVRSDQQVVARGSPQVEEVRSAGELHEIIHGDSLLCTCVLAT